VGPLDRRIGSSRDRRNHFNTYAFSAHTGAKKMHNCAFCRNPLMPLSEWKAPDGHFYCSEFCADAGESTAALYAAPTDFQKAQHPRA
jgi:hypothetical protein